jgi:hypothetical protein
VPTEPNGGPPKGSPMDSPHAQQIPLPDLRKAIDQYAGAGQVPRQDDPGYQPPADWLKAPGTGSRTRLIYRDLPIVTIQNTWTVQQAISAMGAHMIGNFETSGQLCDSVLGDDRVVPTLGSRVSGLFGREVRFRPANDSRAAREVCDAWVDHWPKLNSEGALHETSEYEILMGFCPDQLVWDTTGTIWKPIMRPWHPRFTYYHWGIRRLVAISLDGNLPIFPGDGKWVLHKRRGERPWIRGALRAVVQPWLLRHFAFRDMARFGEVHGMPTRLCETPMSADPGERSQFEQQVARLGFETTLLIGKGVDEHNSYGYSLVEAKDTAWEVFPAQIDRCDTAIVLAILFQNLTTEVKSGALASTEAHMDIRQSGIEADNEAWRATLHNQVARPFAYLNFGDADLAPWTDWDVQNRQNLVENGKKFQQFGTAVEVLRRGGVQFLDVEELRTWAAKTLGLDGLPDFEITDPVASGGMGQ